MSKGADIFIKCHRGLSPLQLCMEYNERWILEDFRALGGESTILSNEAKLFEYVKVLISAGYASRAAHFIDSGFVKIDSETATALMKVTSL